MGHDVFYHSFAMLQEAASYTRDVVVCCGRCKLRTCAYRTLASPLMPAAYTAGLSEAEPTRPLAAGVWIDASALHGEASQWLFSLSRSCGGAWCTAEPRQGYAG